MNFRMSQFLCKTLWEPYLGVIYFLEFFFFMVFLETESIIMKEMLVLTCACCIDLVSISSEFWGLVLSNRPN
jgi:hypothetical protein